MARNRATRQMTMMHSGQLAVSLTGRPRVQSSSIGLGLALSLGLGLSLGGLMPAVAQAADPVAASSGEFNLPPIAGLEQLGRSDAVATAAVVQSATRQAAEPPAASSAQPAAPRPDPATVNGGQPLNLPALNQAVIDQAGLLTMAEREALERRLRAIHDAGRAQIGLIIVPSTGVEPIFDYATRVFTQWKLGNAAADNGLLIIVAAQDRKMQILTGYGLEGVLPDVIVHRIISQIITPAFKQGAYAQGLTAGIDRIDQILQKDPQVAQAEARQAQMNQRQRGGAQQGSGGGGLMTGLFLLLGALFFGQIVKAMLGRFLGSVAVGAGTGLVASMLGLGAGAMLLGVLAFFLLLTGIGRLFGNGIYIGGGGFGGGGFGGGLGGGFGGYGGGGGGFGGGGASGSW